MAWWTRRWSASCTSSSWPGCSSNPYVDEAKVARVVHQPAHRRLARTVAQESIILLRERRQPAAAGPGASAHRGDRAQRRGVQLGDYTLTSATGREPAGTASATPSARPPRSFYAQGCGLWEPSTEGFAEAVAAAERNATWPIVVIGGGSMALAGTGWGADDRVATCGEGFDRTELTPPGVQDELVRAIHATGTPTVVVMVHGRPGASSGWPGTSGHPRGLVPGRGGRQCPGGRPLRQGQPLGQAAHHGAAQRRSRAGPSTTTSPPRGATTTARARRTSPAGTTSSPTRRPCTRSATG